MRKASINESLILDIDTITYSRTRQVRSYEPETLEIKVNYKQEQNLEQVIKLLKQKVNKGLGLDAEVNSEEEEFK
jgi:hypothetical protein